MDEHYAAILAAHGGDAKAAARDLLDFSKTHNAKASAKHSVSTEPVLIKLDHVNRRYKLGHNKVAAVNDVSLEIRQGELVAITGPSGSGKSTLLNLIGGLDKPDTGDIVVDGHNLARLNDRKLSEFRNRTVGFVFQFFYLQPFLNVRTNLQVPGMFARLPPAVRAERIQELAEAVGLTDRLDHLPKELSGGQMQRAAIARALLNQPKLILADEPTGNVDRANAHAIIELFAKVRERYHTTIIIVTHDDEVAEAADRRLVLSDGRVTA